MSALNRKQRKLLKKIVNAQAKDDELEGINTHERRRIARLKMLRGLNRQPKKEKRA